MRGWALAVCLFMVACVEEPSGVEDGGSLKADGGRKDGGNVDAGRADAGFQDAGTLPPADSGQDAGVDGGEGDSGMDAGSADAGVDSGIPAHCAQRLPGAEALEPFARQRTTTDLPDDAPDEWQIHVLYVEPTDRVAATPLDTNGSIRRSVTAFNKWLAYRTGGPQLRFDTCGGTLDVTYVKLPPPNLEAPLAQGTTLSPNGPAYLRDRLEAVLKLSFDAPKKLYLVYYDGLAFNACGGAPYPPLLPGRFTVMYVGGVFRSSFLSAGANSGVTTISVHPTAELALPIPPFNATLGQESVTVTHVGTHSVTLQAPLLTAHVAGEVLLAQSNIPDCRSNPYSSDGEQLNYVEFSGIHECFHALGIVPANAVDYAPMPVAGGHLADSNPAGTADVMYQGNQGWGCQEFPSPANAAGSACQLDFAHRNYFSTAGATQVDLAKSVFLEPTPAAAVPPPSW